MEDGAKVRERATAGLLPPIAHLTSIECYSGGQRAGTQGWFELLEQLD